MASEWEDGVPSLNYISGMEDQKKGWNAEMFSRMMVKEYQLKTTPQFFELERRVIKDGWPTVKFSRL